MLADLLRADFDPGQLVLDPEALREFADDVTEAHPQVPAAVVYPRVVPEVQRLVTLARENGFGLCPRVANQNVGGIAIPAPGAVVVDMSRMNRVHEVSETDMYAVIEPGVTQQEMKDYLESHAPSCRIGYTLAPPDTSVAANCILDGLTNYSLRCGSMSECILGLEAVMHDGSILRTGAWAVGPIPYGKPPMPDLSGLFVSWQGTTGIVTKISLALWPQPKFRERMFVLSHDCWGSFEVMRQISRFQVCDDMGVLSWPTGRMMMGVERPDPVKAEGEYAFFTYLDVCAQFPDEFAWRSRQARQIVAEIGKGKHWFSKPLKLGDLTTAMPQVAKFQEFPTDLEFLTQTEGGGLSWMGSYGPLSTIHDFCTEGMECMVRHGFPPSIVARAMKGGHFSVLRFIEVFKKGEEEEAVAALNLELFKMGLKYGFVQYKPPVRVVPHMLERMDPAHKSLMNKVKQLMDPDGIFNPGKLGFE